MRIEQLIFFTNENSRKCSQVHDFIQHNQMPVTYFRVGSKGIANKLKNGKHFSIVGVPSLVALFEDGNFKVFQGEECQQFLEYIVSQYNDEEPEASYTEQSAEILTSTSEFSDDLFSEDAELIEEFESQQQKNIVQNTGKVDVQLASQQAEKERDEFEKMFDRRKRKRR